MRRLDLSKAIVRTERLVLRPLRATDAEQIFELFADWRVVRFLSAPPWPYSLDDAQDFVRRSLNPDDQDTGTALAITHDDAIAGGIGVRMRSASHLQRAAGPNIGFWLGYNYWGRGYMTEAVRSLVRLIFDETPADAIYSGAFSENVDSLHVQHKVGFRTDGETLLAARPRNGLEFRHVNTVLTRASIGASGS
jgi:RimJ/RimL family protein N-acetyltransferase